MKPERLPLSQLARHLLGNPSAPPKAQPERQKPSIAAAVRLAHSLTATPSEQIEELTLIVLGTERRKESL